MSKPHHPIRDTEIRTFVSPCGNHWIGRLFPYHLYPIFSHGSSEEEVKVKLEVVINEAINNFEESYVKRELARAKRKATLLAKESVGSRGKT